MPPQPFHLIFVWGHGECSNHARFSWKGYVLHGGSTWWYTHLCHLVEKCFLRSTGSRVSNWLQLKTFQSFPWDSYLSYLDHPSFPSSGPEPCQENKQHVQALHQQTNSHQISPSPLRSLDFPLLPRHHASTSAVGAGRTRDAPWYSYISSFEKVEASKLGGGRLTIRFGAMAAMGIHIPSYSPPDFPTAWA